MCRCMNAAREPSCVSAKADDSAACVVAHVPAARRNVTRLCCLVLQALKKSCRSCLQSRVEHCHAVLGLQVASLCPTYQLEPVLVLVLELELGLELELVLQLELVWQLELVHRVVLSAVVCLAAVSAVECLPELVPHRNLSW